MWITAAEFARMERAIEDSLQRAIDAEKRLAEERKRLDDIVASERQSKDWMTLQMASRVVTKHGGYGLDHEPPKPAPPHPKGFIREEELVDTARLEFYKKNCRDVGRSEEEAIAVYEAEMRGESPAYPYEQEELIG